MNEKRKLIDAEELYSELRKAFAWKDLSEEQITIYEAIEAAPTVDAVEVVYCRECAYQHTDDCSMTIWDEGEQLRDWVKDDGFCSWGVRKEEHNG